jgi:hypothetical protein
MYQSRFRSPLRRIEAPAWTDRVSCVALTAGVGAVLFVALRLAVAAHGQIARFVLAEMPFVDPAKAPRGLPILATNGYDGQFYYRLALDPANLHLTAFGIRLDGAFRLERIGYPALAWIVAIGHRPWVPSALVIVNCAAVAAVAALGAMFARDARRSAMWGLAFAAFSGFVFSVSRDTAEPLAAALLLGGLLAYRRRQWLLAAVLFSAGVLTRETILVAVGAIALTRLSGALTRRWRLGWEEATWVMPALVFAGWELVVNAVIGIFPYRTGDVDSVSLPFKDLSSALHRYAAQLSPHHLNVDAWYLEIVLLAVLLVAALASLPSTEAPVHERVALVAYAVQAIILSHAVWDDLADLRQLYELYLFSVIVLISTPRRSFYKVALIASPAFAVAAIHRVVSL